MRFPVTYRRSSTVAMVGGLVHVFLAAMERQRQAAPKPWLFHGRLAQPLLFRDGLLSLNDVVQARFYRPDLWRLRDPVVSVEDETVRLECFSSDAGVYARVDCDPDVFHEGELGSPGTTNVDFGTDFSAQLSSLRPGKPSAFEVGEQSVALHTEAGTAVEKQVELPEPWLRGFLQVQAIQRAASPRFSLGKVQARLLLNAVPAQRRGDETLYVTPAGTLTPTQSASEGLEVSGLHRLKLLRRLAPHVQGLYIWAAGDRPGGTRPTFWVADLGPARITMGLSSAVSQGFSGDGEALRSARRPLEAEQVERARARVAAGGRFSQPELARELEVSEEVAGQVVDLLGEQGLLGYDLARGSFYPRHLPYVEAEGFAKQAREVNSRRLLAGDRVEVEARTSIPEGERRVGWVEGDHATYRVRLTLSPEGAILDGDCTCSWILQHGLGRGPCKHMLALRLSEEGHGRGGAA